MLNGIYLPSRTDLVRNLSQAEKLAEGVLRISSIDWPVLMSHDSMGILSIMATIKKQMDNKKNKVRYSQICFKDNLYN